MTPIQTEAVALPTKQAEPQTDIRKTLREIPAWGASLMLHLAILAALGTMTRMVIVEPEWSITTSVDDVEPDEYKFDSTVVDIIGNDSDVNVLGPSQAAAQHVAQDQQKELEEKLESELLTVDEPDVDTLPEPSKAEFLQQFEATGSTEHPGGVEGSIDRLTLEIAGSLRERKTLVVWLFDESLSVKERRNTIAERFENVYRQLGMLKVDTNRGALKTAVASFGERTHIMTPQPVNDMATLVEAVRNIKPDESGKENVFAAVQTVTNKWLNHRTKMRRNMMIVLVTDERGDDYAILETTINKLSRYGIRVYCVGNAAIFGREQGYVTWTYEDGFKEDLPVDQGPETVAAERLRLPFWGASGRGLERMSSGYGPYALTRLCAETGGMFLVAAESRGPGFDPAVMRNYLPDYRPIRHYQDQLAKNLAKRQLVGVSAGTRVDKVPMPRLSFPAPNDAALRTAITEAQKPAAEFDYKLREIVAQLSVGEKDREKLDSPRWQASYDLAMGRALAMQVRALGYNTVLADMKSSPKTFTKKGNNQWRLRPSAKIDAGPAVKKMMTRARTYLNRVIDEHAGTPWAMLAERELGSPMGWAWTEGSVNITRAGRGAAADPKKRIQLAEEQRRREMAKKKAAARAKARPKL